VSKDGQVTEMARKKMHEVELRKIGSVRVFEQVAEQLRRLITEGHLEPGDQLPSELRLSQALEVSRASVREALRLLESTGLIEVKTGAGTFVAPPRFSFTTTGDAIEWLVSRRDSLLHLLEVRESVEGLTAALAAPAIRDEQLAQLQGIVDRQRELADSVSNVDQELELDVRFHALIAQASRNTIAQDIVNAIVPVFFDSNRVVLYLSREAMEKTLAEHQRIVDALAAGDAKKAELAMRAHIARVRGEIRQVQPQHETAQAE
jgi:GntR family transcriptional repressor for pyruvate dehydrogenase complex